MLRGWCDRFGLWVECLRMLVELYCYSIPPVATAENTVQIEMAGEHTNAQKPFRSTTLIEDVDFCILSSLIFCLWTGTTRLGGCMHSQMSSKICVHSHSPLLWWWWPVLSADIYFGVGRYSRRMGTQDYLRTQYLKMLNVRTWIHPFMTCLIHTSGDKNGKAAIWNKCK